MKVADELGVGRVHCFLGQAYIVFCGYDIWKARWRTKLGGESSWTHQPGRGDGSGSRKRDLILLLHSRVRHFKLWVGHLIMIRRRFGDMSCSHAPINFQVSIISSFPACRRSIEPSICLSILHFHVRGRETVCDICSMCIFALWRLEEYRSSSICK